MDAIREKALLADLGQLKGAHNNMVTKFGGDVDLLTNAVKQLVAAITDLQQRIGVLEQRLGGAAQQPLAQPQAQPSAPQRAPAAAPIRPPPVMADPVTWGHDEEDADLVE